jgi:hypothetical protein
MVERWSETVGESLKVASPVPSAKIGGLGRPQLDGGEIPGSCGPLTSSPVTTGRAGPPLPAAGRTAFRTAPATPQPPAPSRETRADIAPLAAAVATGEA